MYNFRILRDDECIGTTTIVAKDPSANETVKDHVQNGDLPSQWISASRHVGISVGCWLQYSPECNSVRIALIENSAIVDPALPEYGLKGRFLNYARHSQEVLYKGEVIASRILEADKAVELTKADVDTLHACKSHLMDEPSVDKEYIIRVFNEFGYDLSKALKMGQNVDAVFTAYVHVLCILKSMAAPEELTWDYKKVH